MGKAKERNTTFLSQAVSKISNDEVRNNALKAIALYKQRNISQFGTLQKIISSLKSKDEKKIQRATKELETYEQKKPINERIRDKYVRTEKKNMDKPQSNIKFKIAQKTPNFYSAMTMLKPKLEKEIEHLLSIKHEFKLSLIISADFIFPKKDIGKL